MAKRWRIQPHDSGRIADLERSAGVSPIVAQLLLRRGITRADAVQAFLEARFSLLRDPESLPGAMAAAERIHCAAGERRRIVIYGDYDADGMTGTAILYRCLRLLGADVGYFVPNRLEDGYGLNEQAIRDLALRGARMIVSVDCGIGSRGPADVARELGIELIITDHHHLTEPLPAAAAIVHPTLPGHASPFTEFCGAGVAFKLAWAICQLESANKRVTPALREFLLVATGLAALGTVADIVPLLDENRVLVRHGLASLRSRPVPGIQALLELTKLSERSQLSADDIAFTLAPRLNAAGRLGQAQLGVELLITEDAARARALAEYIHELNNSRDSLERSIYLAANKQAQEEFDPEGDAALVLAGHDWHAGVIGIVAGRLAEKYHRPVVVISFDPLGVKPGTGSARSASGLHLHDALASCSQHLLGFGGHAAAAGLKIAEAELSAFRTAFCEYVAEEVQSEARVPEIRVDAEAPLAQLTLRTVDQIESLSPFGAGNPRPVLCACGVQLAAPPKRIGGGERHVSLRVRHPGVTLRAIAFGKSEWFDELTQLDGPFDIAYRPVINQYAGQRSVELHLLDWRAAAIRSTPTAVAGR